MTTDGRALPQDALAKAALVTLLGVIRLAVSSRGVRCIALPGTATARQLDRHVANGDGQPCDRGTESERLLQQAVQELGEYFAGTRQQFSVPVDPQGTDFQHQVWQAVARIGYGATSSYGAIARAIGEADRARAVGAANGANPVPIIIPCHRVLGADGSLVGYGGGLPMKLWLLKHEKALIT